MKKNQMSLLKAQSLSRNEMKNIKGGAGTAGLLYYCTVSFQTSCIAYSSRAQCVASGCPSTKCRTYSLCIEP
jgi:hypothetical protein